MSFREYDAPIEWALKKVKVYLNLKNKKLSLDLKKFLNTIMKVHLL